MTDAPKLVDIEKLKPHPANPRLVEREDVITAIEQQIRAGGFDPSHAILARPHDGGYQILSGHNRTTAAKRAGLTHIPAWVREMDDETAFMQLVLANAQGELSPLERGMHALVAINKVGDIKAYSDATGRKRLTVQNEIHAARVARSACAHLPELLNCTNQLRDIHGAPESCWPALVARLVEQKWTTVQARAAVRAVNDVKPPRGYESMFAIDRLQAIAAHGENAAEIVKPLVRAIERSKADIREGGYAVDDFMAQFADWLVEHGPWDAKATTTHALTLLETQRQAREEAEAKATKLKRPVTLAEWNTLLAGERETLLGVRNDKAKLLKQDRDSAIDWARFSWNPVTGCQHNCPYCYARDIAERFYTQKFDPSIIPDALAAPLNSTPSKEAAADVGYKNVFTCSMADLFGKWVPREWIEAVLTVMREAKQWNFLLLTKFPQRYAEFEFPENVWLGTTVDCQARVANAERAMAKANATVKWLSIEPLIEPMEIDFSIFQWVVIGGASRSAQTPEWKPPRTWVFVLTAAAMDAGCAVYHKANLNFDPLHDYPGVICSDQQVAPGPFHYLKEATSGRA